MSSCVHSKCNNCLTPAQKLQSTLAVCSILQFYATIEQPVFWYTSWMSPCILRTYYLNTMQCWDLMAGLLTDTTTRCGQRYWCRRHIYRYFTPSIVQLHIALHRIPHHWLAWDWCQKIHLCAALAHNVNTIGRLSDVQGTNLPNSTPAAPVVMYRHQRYWVESGTGHISDQEWWGRGGQ